MGALWQYELPWRHLAEAGVTGLQFEVVLLHLPRLLDQLTVVIAERADLLQKARHRQLF